MSTRFISWEKGGRCVRLTTLPLSSAVVMKSGSLNLPELSGLVQGCNGIALSFCTEDLPRCGPTVYRNCSIFVPCPQNMRVLLSRYLTWIGSDSNYSILFGADFKKTLLRFGTKQILNHKMHRKMWVSTWWKTSDCLSAICNVGKQSMPPTPLPNPIAQFFFKEFSSCSKISDNAID
jgi:hypothetical protein